MPEPGTVGNSVVILIDGQEDSVEGLDFAVDDLNFDGCTYFFVEFKPW